MIIDNYILDELTEQAKVSPRLRMNLNFHESLDEKCHRFLNALEPGTVVPIHRHPTKDETFVLLRGKVRVTTHNDDGSIMEDVILSPEEGCYGMNIPKGVWHKVESLESSSILFECKEGPFVPHEFRCYTLNFADPIFERIFREEKGFDIVANFSAHKHVRSEKDRYSVQALIENNDIKTKKLMDLLKVYPPKHFFCVSTDKAANPVNIMGASKRIMEDLVMAYNKYFKVTTARFANVAFSNGSLPDGWIHRLQKKQPLVAPSDVKRYFVSPEESGQICMLACILGNGGEVFFPKLGEDQMLTFSAICDEFVKAEGFEKKQCANDAEAVSYAAQMGYESETYPVVYFGSDTTGEKAYEEFYVPGEKIDMQRFAALGVVEQTVRHSMDEVDGFFEKLEGIFAKDDFTKAQVVDAIREFIPNFEHEEKGKNLDQKM